MNSHFGYSKAILIIRIITLCVLNLISTLISLFRYCIKIVRSPDGQSRTYAIGQFSIQRAAAWVLEKYYTDFPIFNPFLETYPDGAGSVTGQKSAGNKYISTRNTA